MWSNGILTRQPCRKMRPLFVPGEQKEFSFSTARSAASSVAELLRATSACAGRSTIRQFVAWRSVAWRSVIGRDGDEACITDHVDQNFQPHGHDAPFPATATPQGPCLFLRYAMIRPARSHGSRSRAAAGCPFFQMKTPPASEDADGVFRAFTSRKVAALKRKTSRHRLRSRHCGILSAEFSCVPPGALRRR